MKTITIAGGCFWGVEQYFRQFDGIVFTEVCYVNGPTINPTYQEVCNNSGHAEAVYLLYDENIISLKEIIDHYFKIIDPTLLNQQGNDIGIQYRTGIYYEDHSDREKIHEIMAEKQKQIKKDIVVEVMPLVNSYRAESQHQQYLQKNPDGYCHIPDSLLNL